MSKQFKIQALATLAADTRTPEGERIAAALALAGLVAKHGAPKAPSAEAGKLLALYRARVEAQDALVAALRKELSAAVAAKDAAAELIAALRAQKTEKPATVAAPESGPGIRKGAYVRVVAGKAGGVEGKVFWTGNKGYGPRVGIRDDSGATHWADERHCRAA